MSEHLKSGRQALRLLYFLVISFSITRSISLLFAVDNQFSLPQTHKLLLFAVFLSFISRFFLGAYRVLSENIEIELRRPKILIDIFGFFIQALLFYVFSLNFYDLVFSQWTILLICSVDLVWLLILSVFYGIKSRTYKQWMRHNVFFIAFCPLNIYLLQSPYWLLAVSIGAFIYDIWSNVDFYFAKALTGLRIFVAGPYGDNQPPEVIAANVERARNVGKELALKGHFPFIPHTMLHGWETDGRFTVDHFKRIDFTWLDSCDALFFIAPSPGANLEKEIATKKGLQIFTSLESVPPFTK